MNAEPHPGYNSGPVAGSPARAFVYAPRDRVRLILGAKDDATWVK